MCADFLATYELQSEQCAINTRSIQRRTGRSAEESGVHVEDGVMTFVASPGNHDEDHGKAAGAKSEAGGEAVLQVIEANIPSGERDFSFVGHEGESEWSPDGMLEGTAQEEDVGSAKAAILITTERGCGVDVGSAERRLKIERDYAAGRVDRFGKQKAEAQGTVQVSRVRHRWALFCGRAAFIGAVAVGVSGLRLGVAVEKERVIQIQSPALEGVVGVGGREELLKLRQVVQLNVVPNDRFHANAFGKLEKSRLGGEARGGCLGVQGFDRRAGLAVFAPKVDEAAVYFPEECKV